jgi:hypothetical protein
LKAQAEKAAALGEAQLRQDRINAGLDPATGRPLPFTGSTLSRVNQQPAASRQGLDLRVNVFGLSASVFTERTEDGRTYYDFTRTVTIHPPRASAPIVFSQAGDVFERTLPELDPAEDISTYISTPFLDRTTISTAGSGTDTNFYTASGETYGFYDSGIPSPSYFDSWRYDILQQSAYTHIVPAGTGSAYVIVAFDVNYKAERIRTTYTRSGTIFNPPTSYDSTTTVTATISTLFQHSYESRNVECFFVTDTTAVRVNTPTTLQARVDALYPAPVKNATTEINAGTFGPFPGVSTPNTRTRTTVSTGGSTFTWAETSSYTAVTVPKAESTAIPYAAPLSRYLGGSLAWTPAAALTLLAGPVTTKTQSEVTPEEIATFNNYIFMESQGFGANNITNTRKYYIDTFDGTDTEGNRYTFVEYSEQRPTTWGDPVPNGKTWPRSPVVTPALQGEYTRHSNWGNSAICSRYVAALGLSPSPSP